MKELVPLASLLLCPVNLNLESTMKKLILFMMLIGGQLIWIWSPILGNRLGSQDTVEPLGGHWLAQLVKHRPAHQYATNESLNSFREYSQYESHGIHISRLNDGAQPAKPTTGRIIVSSHTANSLAVITTKNRASKIRNS